MLLVDEPSIGLEPRFIDMVFEILGDLQRKEGKTIVMVEQNAKKGLEFADIGYVLAAGQLALAGRGAGAARRPQGRSAVPRRLSGRPYDEADPRSRVIEWSEERSAESSGRSTAKAARCTWCRRRLKHPGRVESRTSIGSTSSGSIPITGPPTRRGAAPPRRRSTTPTSRYSSCISTVCSTRQRTVASPSLHVARVALPGYHCSTIHPELCEVSPPTSGGDNLEPEGAWLGGAMDLYEGVQTMSLDGKSHAPMLPDLAKGAGPHRLLLPALPEPPHKPAP